MLLSLAAPVAILVLSGFVLGPVSQTTEKSQSEQSSDHHLLDCLTVVVPPQKLTFTALVAISGLICAFLLLIHLCCTQQLPHKQKVGDTVLFSRWRRTCSVVRSCCVPSCKQASNQSHDTCLCRCAVAAVQAVAPESKVLTT